MSTSFVADPKRDASACIRGYVFQVEVTIANWLTLPEGSQLFLESGEDIDIVSDTNGRTLIQVRDRKRRVTISSTLGFVARSYASVLANPGWSLEFLFHSSSPGGAKTPRSNSNVEIRDWNAVRTSPANDHSEFHSALRRLVKTRVKPKYLGKKEWDSFVSFVLNGTYEELMRFVGSVQYSVGTGDLSAVASANLSALRTGFSNQAPAESIHERLFYAVFKELSSAGSKVLTREKLLALLSRSDTEAEKGEATAIRQLLSDQGVRLLDLETRVSTLETTSRRESSHKSTEEYIRLLQTYRDAFVFAYGPLCDNLVSFDVRFPEDSEPIEKAVVRALSGENLNFLGPSGCGKTLASYKIATDFCVQGGIAVVLPAVNYSGDVRQVLDAEVSELDVPSFRSLLEACSETQGRLLLVVDGYNECAPHRRSNLIRSVAAIVRQSKGSVVITSQVPIERRDLLTVTQVDVPTPSSTTKAKICTQITGQKAISDGVLALLESVSSGLEARIVGELGSQLVIGSSRFAILDSYVRRLLGDLASHGITVLSEFARALVERISFSLSQPDFDRLAVAMGFKTEALSCLCRFRFIVERGTRVSFGHELFFRAFDAESVVRQANGDPSILMNALSTPVHKDSAAMIVGAIDNEGLLISLLPQISDQSILESCISGECGLLAKRWVEREIVKVIERVGEEISGLVFELKEDAWMGLSVVEQSLLPLTSQEHSLLAICALRAKDGYYFDDILSAVGSMDRKLSSELSRLSAEARERELKLPIRSALFGNMYVFARGPGIGNLVRSIESGFPFRSCSEHGTEVILEQFQRDDLTPGQLYLLLGLARHHLRETALIAPRLPQLFEQHWRFAPYHLRLDLVQTAGYCRNAGEADRLTLIDTLNSLDNSSGSLGISSTIVDALKSLGALDEDEANYTAIVRDKLKELLTKPDNSEMQDAAAGIWTCQFDHPYESAFNEAIQELSSDDQSTFLIMAARGINDENMFASLLIQEIGDRRLTEASPVVARWLRPPKENSFMPQESINLFYTSYVVMAQLRSELTDEEFSPATPVDLAFAFCGRALYWLCRDDLNIDTRRSHSIIWVSSLGTLRPAAAVFALSSISEAGNARREMAGFGFDHDSLVLAIPGTFPVAILAICKNMLLSGDWRSTEPRVFVMEKRLHFAVRLLGHYGDREDLLLLRSLAIDPELGSTALRAIGEIELRSETRAETANDQIPRS
jgi:hypothetical protein